MEKVEQVVEVVEEVVEPVERRIDLDKFDKTKQAVEPVNELEQLKAELEKERLEKAKFKQSFDKKASEAAKLTAQLRTVEKDSVEPIEKLSLLEQQLAHYQMTEKKTNLLYSLTESLGVGKDMSNKIVSSIYNEDTNEVVVGDLENALRDLVDEVRQASYDNGYQTREKELASGKPRSRGSQEPVSAAEKKRLEYLAQRGK